MGARFPSSVVGPSGSENRMQREAAGEMIANVRNHWKRIKREVEDLCLEAGRSNAIDSSVGKNIEDLQQQTEGVRKRIQETTRSRCFQTTTSEASEAAWTVVAGSCADA